MGAADPNASSDVPGIGIHPDARAGGGGTGYFRDANSILGDDALLGTVRHAKSPASRHWVAQANVTAASAGKGGAKKKTPPPTTRLTKQLARASGSEVNFDVRVRVLPDKRNDRSIPATSAKTRVMPSSGLRNIPGMRWRNLDGKIKSIAGKLVVRGIYEIQTSYGRKAKPTDVSRYGRGTTTNDEKAGNITLGFHEWCHQQEFLDYLLNTPFPTFKGKLGMTEEDFLAADAAFKADFQAFGQGILKLGDAVDEVGYTKSRCVADGKC